MFHTPKRFTATGYAKVKMNPPYECLPSSAKLNLRHELRVITQSNTISCVNPSPILPPPPFLSAEIY